jgi:hypothetical protein
MDAQKTEEVKQAFFAELPARKYLHALTPTRGQFSPQFCVTAGLIRAVI